MKARARFSLPASGRWRAGWLGLAFVLAASASAAGAQPCDDALAQRRAYFGDVHVHSSYSFDSHALQSRNTPVDAYAFAQGSPVGLAPLDEEGNPTRSYQLRAALDFAAVTDHAELLGETSLCTTLGLPLGVCDFIRDGPFGAAALVFGAPLNDPDPERIFFCGADGETCLDEAESVWAQIQSAANQAYQPCSFSTFTGYEWTANTNQNNLHRNVLFAGSDIPSLPLSYFEAQTPVDLLAMLEAQCAAVGGDCDVLSIPHNSNQSGGASFDPLGADGLPMTLAEAELRARMEPLVELMQHKGDSECRVGVGSTDEFCDFEKIVDGPPAEDAPLAYVRNVLKEGLLLSQELGTNPFRLGILASSDTHNGTPGATQEDDYPGHVGEADATPAARLSPGAVVDNPGGLMVLWAEENTRESLFAAMQRRESYATSGTRPRVRLFGGFGIAEDHCQQPDVVEQGYAGGVPMGGRLVGPAPAGAPRFTVLALQDPGAGAVAGTRLAELQLVKGWVDDQGQAQERVIRALGGPVVPGTVDPSTCEVDGGGAGLLCGTWTDDDFDPQRPAFYYARVLESPTCRWSQQLCVAQGIDCSATPPAGFEACCDGSVPLTIQERAVTSPIWFEPATVAVPAATSRVPAVLLVIFVGSLALWRRSRNSAC